MQGPIKILKFIWNHPLASKNRIAFFKKFFAWQIGQKINRHPVLYPLVENSKLLVQKGMAGATGNIYTGLLEFDDMAFVLHALRQGDTFADIGANIGVYTILASKNAKAKVISIEPIPSTFSHLKTNVFLNDVNELVTLLQVGVGEHADVLRFTNSMDTINHIVRADEKINESDVVSIPVKTIDEIFANDIPAVIKIDVEGFEWPALNGAKKILASTTLKAIIIELNGCGNSYGFSDEKIHELLLSYGFNPYTYEPFSRKTTPLATHGKHNNTIYLRDIDWVNERVKKARAYKIQGQNF